MGDGSGIEWTDATWNPLVGCTKVSPGCDHCYAETVVNTRLHPAAVARAYDGGHEDAAERLSVSAFPAKFDVVTLRPDRFLLQPLSWRRPRRVFVNSLSDLFHGDVPDEFIARVFAVMALAPQHQFQLLTKRHARMRALLSRDAFRQGVLAAAQQLDRVPDDFAWPLPNVWLGVSVENQHWADIRVPALLDTPAAVRWLSCEPLLGPVDLSRWLRCPCGDCDDLIDLMDWVVVGGESGPGARPMHPDWAREIREACGVARVPFLFKQWGDWYPVGGDECPETAPGAPVPMQYARTGDGWSGDQWYARLGKRRSGRELDGVTHDGYPR